MELKTKVHAEDSRQEVLITREFELPVALLFKAFTEPEIIEEWMSNKFTTMKVLKLESKKHGSYKYETTDSNGNVVFSANGVIHEFIADEKIIRTFEMGNAPFGVQLELYSFEKLTADTSKLTVHVLYESVTQRDQLLKLPFAQGLNMAHNRIQDIMLQLK